MSKFTKYYKYVLLLLLAYFPIFSHLSKLPIRIWDEARLGITAFEMSKNGNILVTHFGYEPDMWSTKPPFLIWFQAIFIKILGLNELAIRLPSALAGLFTCLLLLFFSIRYLKNAWFGCIAVLVLITSQGYFDTHSVRTGDYDATLTFLTTLSGLLIFIFLEKKKNKFLYSFFFVIACAVLTKSIAGLFFLPAIGIYILIEKQFLVLLKNKHFYLGGFIFLSIVFGFYFLREFYNQGYLKAVWGNDLGGRFSNSLSVHKHPFWFYFQNMIHLKYSYWYTLVPVGSVLGFFHKNKKINKITLFSTLMVVCFFLIISFAQTKIEWYNMPMYPFLALLVTIVVYFVFDFFQNWNWGNQNLKYNILPFVFLFLIFITPYRNIINKTFFCSEKVNEKKNYEITNFLRNATKKKYDLNNHFVLYDGYNAHNLFYLKVLNEQGINISFKNWTTLKKRDLVVVSQENIKNYVVSNYKYDIIFSKNNIVIYEIL